MDAITTDRLVLRNFRKGDANDLLAYLREPRASCFLSLKLEDLAAAEVEVETRSRSDEHIAVCLRGADRLIGDVFCVPEPPDTHAVGWNFNADFGGAGFAFEAARALFQYLFAEKQARRLYAYVEEGNSASQRLCERLRMRREGVFKEFVSFTRDHQGVPIFENTMQYAILRKEWVA
ncbi:Protein N-acetyltransferase, RimJ/RimL family [Enhydrobacter aerosaccus]|uniref:Protein N-acetyltransferase, RimJ/RimL family n=1 Tax=Enhydrobacter aerosaccus TaxID=225324 RepID=A0A1T4SH50_9HYPH|nr:GNAT family protein [Enhydrobacter aerosaccus]SKA27630.1 Protein N-acetyltransferase, RimJ/RimL family [Enhydrobacter aerosaccus]